MTKDQAIAWIANDLYMSGQARSKEGAQGAAEAIVRHLMGKGVLAFTHDFAAGDLVRIVRPDMAPGHEPIVGRVKAIIVGYGPPTIRVSSPTGPIDVFASWLEHYEEEA